MQRVLNFLALFRRERRPGDLIFAAGFLVLALACLVAVPWQAQFLGKKSLVEEPGFWPSVGVGMMVVFGAIHFVCTWNAPRLPGRLQEVILWLRSVEFVLWFSVYVGAVPVIGYLPATLLFAVLLSIRAGYRSVRMLTSAAGLALATVLVFKAGLGVRLPAGAVYQYLPDGIRSFVMVNF
ncbi:Tripartite tricarboxylate transporter TctB family protein (plasmid) [Sulfitobacter sp. THAF37]|uniref:tripartite tricarboxylate transporter TctB family protein n=1 Tax=Sulfitobacter sp. THAF37 TaxID=2587855 RepID=UPI001268127E|nr:tripartite tricarboxylate transporter TctB family protein [Sulfitobacter sp. THAF37]QFT61174.1 Tripartite tricarboxylate transporter TctB family protein [Sulfitobacter sp. THAF37]